MKDQEYLVGLKAFISKEEELLIIQSNPRGVYRSKVWGLPGGKVNEEELHLPFQVTLQREIHEELGRDIKVEIHDFFHAWKYIIPNKKSIVLLGLHCTYHSGEVVLDQQEYCEYAWLKLTDLDTYQFLPGQKEAILKWYSIRKASVL